MDGDAMQFHKRVFALQPSVYAALRLTAGMQMSNVKK